MVRNIVMLIVIAVILSLVACSNQNETYVFEENYISEPSQLEQEVINIDYILVTDASNSIEPQELREGDEFLGLILERFELQEIPFDPGGIVLETIIASFSGEIEVSGELQFWEAIPDAPFVVHKEYYHLFPQLAQSFPRDWTFGFFIQNQMELLDMLGIGSLYELSYVGYNKELTIRINNFTIMHNDNGIFLAGSADALEVISAVPSLQGQVESNTPTPIHAWQDAYAELLRYYAGRALGNYYDERIGGFFILYDIDLDGIPELIVANSFHFTSYLAAYTFSYGGVSSLYIESFADYSPRLSVPPNNKPGIITRFWEGPFSAETLMILDGNRLISEIVISHQHMFVEGFHRWYVDGVEVDEAVYNSVLESVFGSWYETERIYIHEITEANIQDIIFGH